MSHVLIVDDEPSICWAFQEFLREEGHEVSVASSAEQAFEMTAETPPDAIVLDVRLPGMDGISAMEKLHAQVRHAPIVVITAFGNLETAVRALDAGAFDYLTKPFDLEDAAEVVRRALQSAETPSESASIDSGQSIVGKSAAIQAVFKQIAQVSDSNASVLITGESGTGKELVAQAIHAHSRRREAPFLAVCLAALSPTLVESELFGHVKGAFTGAEQPRQGLLEQCHGGTVFLDEIGDAPESLQVKLLRALELRQVTPVGGSEPRQTDFRIIAATNRDLSERMTSGHFREDLFYRLAVFQIELPPLRERLDDIPLLASAFLHKMGPPYDQRRFSDAALSQLRLRPWWGNVRELRNVVEHAAIVARGGTIGPEHLPPPLSSLHNKQHVEASPDRLQADVQNWAKQQFSSPSETPLYEQLLSIIEPPLLQAALAQSKGNRAAAADILGIHRATLRQKIRRHGLDHDATEVS